MPCSAHRANVHPEFGHGNLEEFEMYVSLDFASAYECRGVVITVERSEFVVAANGGGTSQLQVVRLVTDVLVVTSPE